MKIFTVTMVPVNPPYDDAVKNMVINIARRIRRHSFLLVSSFFGKAFRREANVTFLRSVFQKQGRHSMSFMQKLYVFIMVLLNMGKVDLFQFFVTPQPYFSRVFKRLLQDKGKKSLQVVSSIHTLYGKNDDKVIADLFFADRVVVYSDFTKKSLEEKGVKNVVRVYPGIDCERFAPKPGTDSSFNIVYAGSYGVLAGAFPFEDLSAVAEKVTGRFKKANFIMACRIRTAKDILLRRAFEKMVERKGMKDNFTFLDTVEDMPALFRKSDIGIMPAKDAMSGVLEIPMVLLEMACAGKPVIYGDVPPLGELADKGIGIMLADRCAGAYAEKILALLEDRDSAASIGKRSKNAVEKYFNIDVMAREYERIYEDLETGRRRSG